MGPLNRATDLGMTPYRFPHVIAATEVLDFNGYYTKKLTVYRE